MQSALSVGVVRHSSTAAIRCADWTADTTSGSNTRGVTEHSGGYFFFLSDSCAQAGSGGRVAGFTASYHT